MGSDNTLVEGSGEGRKEGEERRASDWAEWGERKGMMNMNMNKCERQAIADDQDILN